MYLTIFEPYIEGITIFFNRIFLHWIDFDGHNRTIIFARQTFYTIILTCRGCFLGGSRVTFEFDPLEHIFWTNVDTGPIRAVVVGIVDEVHEARDRVPPSGGTGEPASPVWAETKTRPPFRGDRRACEPGGPASLRARSGWIPTAGSFPDARGLTRVTCHVAHATWVSVTVAPHDPIARSLRKGSCTATNWRELWPGECIPR